MKANLETQDVFKALPIGSTTPVTIMIILSIALGFLIPFSIILDSVGAEFVRKEQFLSPENKEKTLTDVMFFNKW